MCLTQFERRPTCAEVLTKFDSWDINFPFMKTKIRLESETKNSARDFFINYIQLIKTNNSQKCGKY